MKITNTTAQKLSRSTSLGELIQQRDPIKKPCCDDDSVPDDFDMTTEEPTDVELGQKWQDAMEFDMSPLKGISWGAAQQSVVVPKGTKEEESILRNHTPSIEDDPRPELRKAAIEMAKFYYETDKKHRKCVADDKAAVNKRILESSPFREFLAHVIESVNEFKSYRTTILDSLSESPPSKDYAEHLVKVAAHWNETICGFLTWNDAEMKDSPLPDADINFATKDITSFWEKQHITDQYIKILQNESDQKAIGVRNKMLHLGNKLTSENLQKLLLQPENNARVADAYEHIEAKREKEFTHDLKQAVSSNSAWKAIICTSDHLPVIVETPYEFVGSINLLEFKDDAYSYFIIAMIGNSEWRPYFVKYMKLLLNDADMTLLHNTASIATISKMWNRLLDLCPDDKNCLLGLQEVSKELKKLIEEHFRDKKDVWVKCDIIERPGFCDAGIALIENRPPKHTNCYDKYVLELWGKTRWCPVSVSTMRAIYIVHVPHKPPPKKRKDEKPSPDPIDAVVLTIIEELNKLRNLPYVCFIGDFNVPILELIEPLAKGLNGWTVTVACNKDWSMIKNVDWAEDLTVDGALICRKLPANPDSDGAPAEGEL